MEKLIPIAVKKSFSYVKKSEIFFLVLVYFVNVIASLSEVAGIGMIYALFSVLLDMENFGGIYILYDFYEYFAFQNKKDFLIILAIVTLFVFVFRNIFQGWGVWITLEAKKRIQLRLANELFSQTIRLPYSKLSNIHSSRLIADITANASSAVSHCTLGIIDLLGATTLLILFFSVIFISKPFEALITLPIIIFLCTVYWILIRKRLSTWGGNYVLSTQRMYKNVSESIYGVKSIKVYKSEDVFYNRFKTTMELQMSLAQMSGFMGQLPRLLIETLVVISIMSAVVIFLLSASDVSSLMATLVLFGGVAIRIVPAISRILTISQQFRVSFPALESMLNTLNLKGNSDNQQNSIKNSETYDGIKLQDIWYKFSNEKWTLKGINISIPAGSFVGFVGNSGSGKTTAADVILGLLEPQKGKLHYQKNISSTGLEYSFVPQTPFILEASIKENIAFGVQENLIDMARLEEAIKGSSFKSVVSRFKNGVNAVLEENGGNLSGGERQRLCIARALYFDAPVIVLDEPTSALDADTESEITDVILSFKGKKTIILIAHRLSTVAKCDELFYFEHGEVKAQGSFHVLAKKSKGFATMLNKYKNSVAE